MGLHECGGEVVKRIVLTPETSAIPGQLTASVQWDTLALLVQITLNNYVKGETCDCRLPQGLDENCALLGYYATSRGNLFPTFRGTNYRFLLQGSVTC